MNAVEEFRLQEYQDLGSFDEEKNIRMKRHKIDGTICLEKRVPAAQLPIYQILKEKHIEGIPEIFFCALAQDDLIVIEKYIEGRSLEDYLQQRKFDIKEVLSIADSLCDILKDLHQGDQPVICRDLKAENVMLDMEGKPWLVDFDIARIYQEGKKRDTTLLGTAEYAAPEQFGFFQTDQRTDIYSLGILMNYMSVGMFPVEKMAEGRLGEIVRKCTYLEPEKRYQSIEILQKDLKQMKRDLGLEDVQNINTTPDSIWGSYMPPGFRSRKISHMLLAGAVYGFLLWFCFTIPIEVKGILLTGFRLRFEQMAIFLSQLVFIFFLCGYRGWGDGVPLLKSRNPVIRIIGLAATWFVLISVAAIACIIKENVFF